MLDKKNDSGAGAAPDASASTSSAPGKSTLTGGVLQRSGSGNGGGGSNQEIAASGFSGSPMSVPYQSEMESSFGRSFSSVQAYGGGAAADANSALGSQAYAVGQSVAFADTSPSKEMVAHELAHTVQQGDAGPVQTWSEGSDGDAFETEANDAAASVMAGQSASVSLKTGPAIHKWGGSDHYTIGNLAGQKAMQAAQAAGIHSLTVANIDPAAGGIGHGAQPPVGPDGRPQLGPDGHPLPAPPSQAGDASAHQRDRNRAGGIGSTSTGITTDPNQQQTLGVQTDAQRGTGQSISFGAASRYGGDYSTQVHGTSPMGIPGLGTRTSELSGAGSAQHGGGEGPNLIQFAQMTIGGMTNSNHFFPINGMEYQGHHNLAKSHAAAANKAKMAGDQPGFQEAMRQALQEEGFGSHFLQDTFSSGHMAPRSLDSCEDLHNDRHTTATALNNAATGATSAVASTASSVGSGVGTVTGAVGGFFSRVAHLQNPFSAEGRAEIAQHMQQQATTTAATFGGTAQSAMQTLTSPIRTGGGINQAVQGAERASAFYQSALQGLERSKQWHDYFCALPNGLPTTRGRFHGDYFMDGNDLETVSDTAANSICEVIQIAHGMSFHPTAVEIPRPDFAGIIADPMAGPVWRLMMQDYRASLAQAHASLQPGDTGHTDAGTQYDSAQVLALIDQYTMGGAAGAALPTAAEAQQHQVERAGSDPSGALHDTFGEVRGAIQTLQHYCSTEFGYNANLGAHGLDDNLNAPRDGHVKGDMMGDGTLGRSFDVCQLEGQFGLFRTMKEKVTAYKAVLSTASSNPGFTAPQRTAIEDQITWCDMVLPLLNHWIERTTEFINSSMTIPVAHDADSADVGGVGRGAMVGGGMLGGAVLGGAVAGPLGAIAGAAGVGHVAQMLSGPEGNRIAWGAGHPEWISNSHGRNAWRNDEVVPTVRDWFNRTAAEPDFHVAVTSAPPAAAAAH